MKRITSIIIFAIIICALPFSGALAQEKKSEQKIKIVLSDGSGTEVVIDTLIKDGETNDSIRIKGGKVIYIGHSGDETGVKHNDGSEHVYVYVSSDDKEKNKDAKTITIVSSEPGVSWTEKSGGADSFESSEDMTRSVIAKDGMVVTVEGKDEAKVNELAKEIQKKMGVNPDESTQKQKAKEESKKSVKK
jgi:hypothetical protein